MEYSNAWAGGGARICARGQRASWSAPAGADARNGHEEAFETPTLRFLARARPRDLTRATEGGQAGSRPGGYKTDGISRLSRFLGRWPFHLRRGDRVANRRLLVGRLGAPS
eukprot:scaffold148_cov371-Prasinococcus_capsulatus_cf.AAC.6